MKTSIDLNADLGEGCGSDAALMPLITSCNIACGGHAGDEASMRTALKLAKANGVAAGAHPSFPDRENFGRTQSDLKGNELEMALRTQILSLKSIASELSMPLTHLKPHGALYNMAAHDRALAETIITVLQKTLPGAKLVGPPSSELQEAAIRHLIPFIAEGFADRAYNEDGSLRDRQREGAVITAANIQVRQALEMIKSSTVTTYGGQSISMPIDTVCIHGDTANALEAAKAIKSAIETAGISICAPL